MRKILTLLTLCLSAPAFAGGFGSGTISFAPATAGALPTLSDGVLILLAAILALVAFRVLKDRGTAAGRVASMALAGVAFALAGHGINNTVAGEATSVNATGNACGVGGTAQFSLANDPEEAFINNCPVALRITDITADCDEGDVIIEGGCEVGNIIEVDGRCTLPYCGEIER